jgi:hypothetical protein
MTASFVAVLRSLAGVLLALARGIRASLGSLLQTLSHARKLPRPTSRGTRQDPTTKRGGQISPA